jgi:hypothetical protein
MSTLIKEQHAPRQRPRVRQKIMMVPANEECLPFTIPEPSIMQQVATYPFDAAKRMMKRIGKTSLSKRSGRREEERLQRRSNGIKTTRRREGIHTLLGENGQGKDPADTLPMKSKRL